MSVGSALAGMALARQGTRARALPKSDDLAASGFNELQRKMLRCAMDEIVPAADGMPAASEVGGVEYLERLAARTPDIQKKLAKSLASVETLSKRQFGQGFVDLSRAKRVEALRKLEKAVAPQDFAVLRDFVYESYYLQPQVWKLIGYEFYPTNQGGPHLKPFDDSVLAKVHKMEKIYREVT
jgi:hypothetical protein